LRSSASVWGGAVSVCARMDCHSASFRDYARRAPDALFFYFIHRFGFESDGHARQILASRR
jgi:hypothetical protein